MRALIWIVILLAGLYGGYWFAGSAALRAGVETALDRMQAEGTGEAAAVSLVGFPSRFDLTLAEPVLRDRRGAAEWRAPFLNLHTLSYKPNHLIAVWPHEQSLRLGGEEIALSTADMRASVTVGLDPALPLDHATLTVAEAQATGSGWELGLDRLMLATRRAETGENAHDLWIEVTGIVPGAGLKAAIDPSASLPATAEWLRLDATVELDRPLDRFAGEAPPRPVALEVRAASLRWGDLTVEAQGKLSIDAAGQPEGRITVAAGRWREMLRLATAAGLVRVEIAPTVENALAALASASGDPEVLELPLAFRNGRMSFGPVPLGPAPRLYLQ